jgi:hypothetical protein
LVYGSWRSISDFFQKYSGDQNEANNVAADLGVTPDITLQQLASGDWGA